jgi:hypothetical protein
VKIRTYKFHSIVFSLLLMTTFCQNNASPNWNVGAAKIDITPNFPVWLAGYDRPTKSEGIHDSVWARAIVLENNKTSLLILSTDLIGLFKNDVDDIRNDIVPLGIPFDNIVITCTHNHNGPDVLGLWNADKSKTGVDSDYLNSVKQKLVQVASQAIRNKQKAQLFLSQTTVEGISYNGRDKNITDNSVVVLSAIDQKGDNIATLVNFACHPEVLAQKNNLITSDYCFYLYEKLEKKMGGTALLINGALGGMLTPLITEHSYKEAERCGSTLADAVFSSLQNKKNIKGNAFQTIRKSIKLESQNPNFEALYKNKIVHREFKDNIVNTEVSVIQIGQLEIGLIPGEALPKIGLNIKAEMKADFKMIFGLANDELGYFIPSENWDPNTYEESMSVGPNAGDTIQKEIISLLKKIE